MIRRMLGTAAALLMMAGLAISAFGLPSSAATATAHASAMSVLPHSGSYTGVDHAGRTITFTFGGNQMSHFMINHQVVGGAHVSNGAWHETCHNGMCTKGAWLTDSHVKGSWRTGGGHWVHFDARTSPPVTPYIGPYMGSDHSGLKIHLGYHAGKVTNFTADHNNAGDANLHGNKFDFCGNGICAKGHWENDTTVVGLWRYSNSSHWRQWEAFAYAH